MTKGEKRALFIIAILAAILIVMVVLVIIDFRKPHPAGPIAFNSDGDPLILGRDDNIKILYQDGANKKWFRFRNFSHWPVARDMVLDSGFSGKLYLLDDQKVLEFDCKGDKLAEFGWWRKGSSTNGDLKGGGGHLYFANTALGKVQVFDLYNGDPEKPEFSEEIDKPISLDIDRKGDLYVLTASRYEAEQGFELRKYNLETSKFRGSWEVPQAKFKQPLHIAIDKLRD